MILPFDDREHEGGEHQSGEPDSSKNLEASITTFLRLSRIPAKFVREYFYVLQNLVKFWSFFDVINCFGRILNLVLVMNEHKETKSPLPPLFPQI